MQNMETKTVSEAKAMTKKYASIYADIPWEDEAWPFERIIALPVGPAVAAEALMLMWVPMRLVPDGLLLLRAWGFEYGGLLTFRKPKDELDVCWYRSQCENLLVGKRGTVRNCYLLRHTLYEGPDTGRAFKPEGFRTLLSMATDIAFGGELPQLDLFGRYWHERYPEYGREGCDFIEG
jgi:N6-adenosine-specific RNA methylase IME4